MPRDAGRRRQRVLPGLGRLRSRGWAFRSDQAALTPPVSHPPSAGSGAATASAPGSAKKASYRFASLASHWPCTRLMNCG